MLGLLVASDVWLVTELNSSLSTISFIFFIT